MTCFSLDLLAKTGKSAPKEEPTRMMKMAAMRRAVKSFAPPPDPQLVLSSAEAVAEAAEGSAVEEERASEIVDDIAASVCS